MQIEGGITNPLFWALVLGGLGLFLFGITYLSDSIKDLSSRKLSGILGRATSNRFKSFGIGALFTALIHSSGGTTAITIGLVRAGALTLFGAAGIIIGANVGTTITSLMVAIPIQDYMPFILLIGALLFMLTNKRPWRDIGKITFALGLIFLGLLLMEKNLGSLAGGLSGFFEFLSAWPILGFLMGIVLTIAIQSSTAIIGILQGLYAAAVAAAVASGGTQCSITLLGILPILFGSNIGTTFTSILAAMKSNPTTKRVSFIHVLFNVSTAIIFMLLLIPFQSLLNDSWKWAINGFDPKLQVALFHLAFNIVGSAIFLPLLKLIVKLSEKVFPDKSKNKKVVLRQLDPVVFRNLPLEGIKISKELTLDMFNYTLIMHKAIKKYYSQPNDEDKEYIMELENGCDFIDRHLNEFLITNHFSYLHDNILKQYGEVLKASKDIERIGDYGENILEILLAINEKREQFNKFELKILNDLSSTAISMIDRTLKTYKNSDKNEALRIIQDRRVVVEKIKDYEEEHFLNITKTEKNGSRYIDVVFNDFLNCYERVYSHCSNIAKLFNNDKDSDRYQITDEQRFKDMANRY